MPLNLPNAGNKGRVEQQDIIVGSTRSNVDHRPVTFLRFNYREVGHLVFGPLKRSLYRKVEAQAGLDFLYNPEIEQGMTESEETSPYVMLVMAIVCQVRVSKYSETVVKKGEVPKALHLIVDGQADAVLEDQLRRSPRPSEFCRGVGLFDPPKREKRPNPAHTQSQESAAKKAKMDEY